MSNLPLTVFLDGRCQVCAMEYFLFQRKIPNGILRFVDISGGLDGFQKEHVNLDLGRVQKHLHVQDSTGLLYVGFDSVIILWGLIPGWGPWISRIARMPFVKIIGNLAYKIFAEIRPHLPRREKSVLKT